VSISKNEERALALAGMAQACYLVTGIARTGLIGQDSMAGSLESIFVTNPKDTLDVYRDGNGVRTGLRLIQEILGDFALSDHGDTVRYMLAVAALEKKLRSKPEILHAIGAGISGVYEHRCLHELPATADEIIDRLSRLYEETAGSLEPRIRVQGQQKHLQNRINTSRIRALLLAAIRSAVLWRQVGGGVSQLVLGRRKLLVAVDKAANIIN
jgi:high frequency lysogenization protein